MHPIHRMRCVRHRMCTNTHKQRTNISHQWAMATSTHRTGLRAYPIPKRNSTTPNSQRFGRQHPYLEAQANIAYTDSILPPLLQQADLLLKQFRYEKNEKYETYGRYVHHLLTTSSNTSRNFLQAYVQDNRTTIVKSYYYGFQSIQQEAITLSANGEEIHAQGSNHRFEANGWHEIMTMEDSRALEVLNFISAHTNDRVRVTGKGTKPTNTWVYYLTDKEKQALSDTYQLGWLMKDIKRAEEIQNTAQKQIERFQRNRPVQ